MIKGLGDYLGRRLETTAELETCDAIAHSSSVVLKIQETDQMTILTTKQMISLVEDSYFYNVDNKNLDATLKCFAEDAELTVHTAHVAHRGHDEIRRMFGDFMRETPVIYHGDYSHVTDIDNQVIASQFLARNNLADGSEVSMRNCNFFVLREGLFAKVTIYMSGENPLV